MAFQNYRLRNVETWRAFRDRRRLDTNHTTESFDSGFSSLNANRNDYRIKQRRNIQVDDVLWCCSFILTVWYFELPLSLFIDPRVDWFCLATWNLWNFWTVYIILVTFMFTVVVISFL
uniref:Ion_trans domain-containing protein n=1 Tax=Elaeophora elaphi TaxID=1147741 RepID=A0A0R3S556_9BILA